MNAVARKYNPGFLTDDELVASFCVRTHHFESMIEMLRDCAGSASPHQIAIGPRGSGKTSLLLRVATEIRRDTDLSSRFFPIVFAEESYEVTSAGEFWLEALSRLSAQAPDPEAADSLRRSCEDLRTIRDDQALGDRCLGALLDFADGQDKRLVLVVENLNAMFGDMADAEHAGWRLRKVLQTEPRILLLASATSRFDEIDNPDRALYDLFRVLTLRPLDADECAALWESVSGRRRELRPVRALRILTGGSPRLITILARFGADLSFRELMTELLDLVDDHTEYFKSHLESLPAQERRVYLALASLWKPGTAREIADRARLDTSKCSAQLTRLADRGVVEVTGGSPRRKLYYLTERLYNIYYLMRRTSGSDPLVEALVRFMASYYASEELREIGARIVRDAPGLDTARQPLYRSAFLHLVSLPDLKPHRGELLGSAPSDWVEEFVQVTAHRESPDDLKEARAMFGEALTLAQGNSLEEALDVCDEAMHRFGDSESPDVLGMVARVPVYRATVLVSLDRLDDALTAYDDAVSWIQGNDSPRDLYWVARALNGKGALLEKMDRREDAVAVYGEVAHRFRDSDIPGIRQQIAEALTRTGVALESSDRWHEAIGAYDEILRRFGDSDSPHDIDDVAKALIRKSQALQALDRREDALATYDEVIRRHRETTRVFDCEMVARALLGKAGAFEALHRWEDALSAWDEVVRELGTSEAPQLLTLIAAALISSGVLLTLMGRPEDALAAYDEVIRRFATCEEPQLLTAVETAFSGRGMTLDILRRFEEALAAHDDVLCRLEARGTSMNHDLAVATRFARGDVLLKLNRREAAFDAWNDLVGRYDASGDPVVRHWVSSARLKMADVELSEGSFREAAEKASTVLEQHGTEAPENRSHGHLIRASASLGMGDSSACEQDVVAVLKLLPNMGVLLREVIDDLKKLSLELGPERMRGLIAESPSRSLLLPLTTALERELGIESRVPREVEEVAGDIRWDFARLRGETTKTPDRR